jgi:hypothetical protein
MDIWTKEPFYIVTRNYIDICIRDGKLKKKSSKYKASAHVSAQVSSLLPVYFDPYLILLEKEV